MKQRILALLLALALMGSLCAVSALAGESEAAQPDGTGEAAEIQETAAETAEETAEEAEEPASPAGPDPDPVVDPETGKQAEVAYTPDAVGDISFANLERRMRENNLNLLSLEENIKALETINYDSMADTYGDMMSALADMVWVNPSNTDLQKNYQAAADAYEAIRKGDLQHDNDGTIRQLKNAQDQIVLLGESLYIGILEMETQEAALQRQLTALNRTVEEMELRYQLGQVSALQLEQTKAGRTSLVSGLETLRMNIYTYKVQLESMIGAEMTGEIRLGAIPGVTEKQLGDMDLETDLAAAKEKSYELYDADETLDDAIDNYVKTVTSTNEVSSKHVTKAARISHSATYQNYELKFRTLYSKVGDCKQILDAAKVSLASEQSSYASMQLKYDQGTISKNKLLDAEDSLRTAEEKVQTASVDLFSAYNTYCWAVQHGIINN